MNKASLLPLFVALTMMTTIVGCTSSTRTTESTGQYIDDAAITTKVKTAILGEPGLKSLQIGVQTYQDVVQLSGFVDNDQSRIRAGQVAAGRLRCQDRPQQSRREIAASGVIFGSGSAVQEAVMPVKGHLLTVDPLTASRLSAA